MTVLRKIYEGVPLTDLEWATLLHEMGKSA